MKSAVYDYVIVGAGLFGSVFARLAKDAGKRILVIEKRDHIGGNCYTTSVEGINKHVYGPHIFHTSNEKVWAFINKYTSFNNFTNRPKAIYRGCIYSLPINLMTIHQILGSRNPYEAKEILEKTKGNVQNPSNLEEWCLSQVGSKLYTRLIYGYTKKQWGCEPRDLPASIIKRLPIRLDFNDNYYNDPYQGIPIGGYTQLFKKLLDGIEVRIGIDFIENQECFEEAATKIVYTGLIDELMGYRYGELGYRSLMFKESYYDISDFQGGAIINYTHEDIPWTRSIEHKHFEFGTQPHTIITREIPCDYQRGMSPYYPIPTSNNLGLYQLYFSAASNDPRFREKYIFGGRLAEYKYYDMDATIASAISLAGKEFGGDTR